MSEIRLLTIDQATKASGWAFFEDGHYVESGLIDFSKTRDDPVTRFQHMCVYLQDVILDHQPDELVMEGISFQNNPATLILLARIQGAIIMTCLRQAIAYSIFPASSWRKALGFIQGRGKKREMLKKQAVEYVKQWLDISVSEDIAEAICIGYARILKGDSFSEENKKGRA